MSATPIEEMISFRFDFTESGVLDGRMEKMHDLKDFEASSILGFSFARKVEWTPSSLQTTPIVLAKTRAKLRLYIVSQSQSKLENALPLIVRPGLGFDLE